MNTTGRKRLISPMTAGVMAGILIAFVVGVMAKINIDFAAPWASTHTLTAEVTDADGIAVSSDVRIAGRLVGQITGVQARGDHTTVTFHVDDADWPLPADTTASIRLATLLGQKYLELEPGSNTSAHLVDNYDIGLNRTRPVVDFDQILDTFDKPTRDALTNIIKTLAGGVKNQEGTIQQLLPTLRDLSQHSTTGTGELDKRNPELNSILVNLGTTADQLARSRDDLAGVIDNLNSVTGALAQHQDALRGYTRNVDAVNQTTHQVLGNGGAQELATGLNNAVGVVGYLNALLHDLVPQSQAFNASGAEKSAIDLIYEIGDATSQTNRDGAFLRQSLQTVEYCGLAASFGIPIPHCTAQPGSIASSSSSKSGGTSGPALPSLPGIGPLPTLPPLPVPTLPGLNGGSSPSPTPTPAPLPCLLFCSHASGVTFGYGDTGSDGTSTQAAYDIWGVY